METKPTRITAPSPIYPSKMATTGEAVELNVYDLLHPDNPDAVPTINTYLYTMGMGLYHSGVSVYNQEYCYGGHTDSNTGIFSVSPKTAPDARYRQTILIGHTYLTAEQVRDVVEAMGEVWLGNGYNLLSRNCNHFASDLCERLTGRAAPEWINRLAWMGEKAKFLLPKGFDTPMMAPVRERAEVDDVMTALTREEREFLRDPDHDA